jgi:V/A-type H+-transporting ATPase subunit D
MSFGQNVSATKIELLKYKRSSQVASMVRKILDDKRKVLLKNIEEMITEATKARGGIWEPLQDVYKSVNEAYLTLGTNTVDSVAQSAPAVMEVEVNIKRVVDVKIPALTVTEKDTKSMPYGFADTNSSIDRASKQIKAMLPKICKAAEYENSIFSLAKALEKTQKLLNALENVIIPQYQSKIKFILSTLEEREREEFARLKKVKAAIEKRKLIAQG